MAVGKPCWTREKSSRKWKEQETEGVVNLANAQTGSVKLADTTKNLHTFHFRSHQISQTQFVMRIIFPVQPFDIPAKML
jgi:hypothetical protein